MSGRLLFSVVTAACLLGTVACSSSPQAEPPAPPTKLPASADEAAQRYVPLLKDRDALVRKRAAVALKRLGAKAKTAIPALEEALADKDADVRAAVAAALEAIDPMPRPAGGEPKPPATGADSKPRGEDPFGPKNPPASPLARKAPPSTARAAVGSYHFDPKGPPSILAQRKADETGWHRLKPGARLFSNDRLVSLPGCASEVRLDSGVHLLLRGHVREFSSFPEMDYLQESAVVLHQSKDVDADVSLQRGRLYVSNHKDKGLAVVRLRFGKEVWDLTLHPGAEAVLDLLKRYRGDINYRDGEEPLATLHLLVLQGEAGLAIDYHRFPDLSAPPGPAHFQWTNKGLGPHGPTKVDKVPPFFAKSPSASNRLAEDMNAALKDLSQRMLADKVPTVVLEDVLQKSEQPMRHRLAIYCLGALGEVKKLIAILGDQDPMHASDRDTAIFTLRRWLGRDATHGRLLYDEKKATGLLLAGKEYRAREAEAICFLLHDFSEEDRGKPETFELLANYLQSDKVAIAELARWHLYRLTQGVQVPSFEKFNAAAPREDREKAAQAVKKLVREGKLPPLSKPEAK